MSDLHGKGWRVVGYFLWMAGSGIVFEGSRPELGYVGLMAGAAIFFLGAWQSFGARAESR